ncbi:biotin-dependent carboxyltransferase family protein [Methylocystis sp. B8]|uniref:5-oxoprolinase subunit C family protein n=1 Tax=Methylocystis sp. B8 TaxID=544938 RepID=UPI0010FE96A4|nr:biotin-dependent carboxyltransferase family protein [Methylocystis sp. B8]TLG77734.1 biotin-dependent carboxyltransferase family protein [Methylocystis sp. B8]
MSARLLVEAAGPGVTIQDEGRFGLSRYGVTPAGPMDIGAYLAATRAAGADSAIEISLGGAAFRAEGATLCVAVAGGDFDIRLDGRPLPSACLLPLAEGARLTLRAGSSGAWCYVAVGGRLDLAPTLGSRATHARSGLGPKPLAVGDALPLAEAAPPPLEPSALAAPWLASSDAPIRLLLGPQDDYFALEEIEVFLNARWRIGARSDRMAYRLEGPAIRHRQGHDIVSDGVAMGAIQIPGDGAPLALMADRQPTGGYPKIATVIGADLGRLAQLRPGENPSFRAVSWDEAVATRRAYFAAIQAGVKREPLSAEPTTESLLAENLVGGVVNAKD